MNLVDHLKEIRDNLRSGRYANEAAISQGVVLRLLQALGWPVFDSQVVTPEFTVETRRVDFALCHPPGKPKVFIEVKSVGQTEGGDRQLFEYAFHAGVPLAVLTDGQAWHFYLPAEQGQYEERRVYKLDVLERDHQESADRLKRYLEHPAVCSGDAIERARGDFKDITRDRLIKETLPQAWRKLIEEQDDLLVELLADKVESLCGYKPNTDVVSAFLSSEAIAKSTRALELSSFPGPRSRPPVSSSRFGFDLQGRHYPAHSAREVMTQLLEELHARDGTFLQRFAARPRHGRNRRYVARDRSELYPGKPHLEQYSHQLRSGWWVSTNWNRVSIDQIIRMACEVAGLKYGKDLVVNLGE